MRHPHVGKLHLTPSEAVVAMQAEAYKGQGDRNKLRNIGSIPRREGVYEVLVEESRVWVRLGVEGEFVIEMFRYGHGRC